MELPEAIEKRDVMDNIESHQGKLVISLIRVCNEKLYEFNGVECRVDIPSKMTGVWINKVMDHFHRAGWTVGHKRGGSQLNGYDYISFT
jgi:hypothetical protein